MGQKRGSLPLTHNAFEMGCYRRILRIPCIHHVSNDTVLQSIGGQLEYQSTVKRRHKMTTKKRVENQQDADEYRGCEI